MKIMVIEGDDRHQKPICIRASDVECGVAAVIYMTLDEAEELYRDLRRKIDTIPRLVSAADLGVVAP